MRLPIRRSCITTEALRRPRRRVRYVKHWPQYTRSVSYHFAVLTIVGLAVMVSPAHPQGMRSAASPGAENVDVDLGQIRGLEAGRVATIQRLLQRLGYLSKVQLTRTSDPATNAALNRFLSELKPAPKSTGSDELFRLLFTEVWIREGWGKGQVPGQDQIVEKEKVKVAQDALKQLGYETGPADGKFGPATLAAVESFQEDKRMKIDGLLRRNTQESIVRALTFISKKPKGTVHVLNWPDYIDPDVLSKFQDQTGFEVVHDVFESSEETKDLLVAGSADYDVMVQSSSQMRLVLNAGSLKPLDKSQLPNIKNLDPAALQLTSTLDSDNEHSVPYMWGTVGIAVNEVAVREIVPDVKTNSLAMFLDPAIAKRLSTCGLALVDEPTDVVPAFVAYVGGEIDRIGIADLEAVDQTLARVAPYLKRVSADRFIDDLAEGKYCAAIGYSGDVFQAREAARLVGRIKLTYAVPAEGSQLWFDLLVVPKNARNPEGAYRFIDFLMDPEVAAANTNYLQYANPNIASAPHIDPKLMEDPGLYPPADVLSRLKVLQPLSPKVEAELQRIWGKLSE